MNPFSALYRRISTIVRALYDRFTRPRIKQAAVYARNGKLYICAMSETAEWLWIASPPYLAADGTAVSDEDLGRLVREALDSSRQGLSQPSVPELERVLVPLAKLAGLRNHRAFEKNARNLAVHEQDGTVTLTPSRNAGKDGFLDLSGRKVDLDAPEAPVLGEAVRAALLACE